MIQKAEKVATNGNDCLPAGVPSGVVLLEEKASRQAAVLKAEKVLSLLAEIRDTLRLMLEALKAQQASPFLAPGPNSLVAHPANSGAAIQPPPATGTDDARTMDEFRKIAMAAGKSEMTIEADLLKLASYASKEDWIGRAVRSVILIQAAGRDLREPVRFIWACVKRREMGDYEEGAYANWDQFDNDFEKVVVRTKKASRARPNAKTFDPEPGLAWTDEELACWQTMTQEQKRAWQKKRGLPVTA